jgi:hypothetical protein
MVLLLYGARKFFRLVPVREYFSPSLCNVRSKNLMHFWCSTSTVNCIFLLHSFKTEILRKMSDQEKYNVKNAQDFKRFIDITTLEKDYVLISNDVTVFTNVPVNLAIIKRNWNRISNYTTLSKIMFVQLIEFYVEECGVIQFENKLYKQISACKLGLLWHQYWLIWS